MLPCHLPVCPPMDFYLAEQHKSHTLWQQSLISRETKGGGGGGHYIFLGFNCFLFSQGIHEEPTTQMNGIIMSPGIWGAQRNLGSGAEEKT